MKRLCERVVTRWSLCLPGVPLALAMILLSCAGATLPAAAQGASRGEIALARETLVNARQLLEAGSYWEAESTYASVLGALPRSDSLLRAAAHFGRAFAAQQRLVTGDTIGARADPDGIVLGYRLAAELNPRALGPAAENNIAVVLGAVGRNADAARAFLALAEKRGGAPVGAAGGGGGGGRGGGGVATIARSSDYVNAGRQFEAAADTTSALRAYRSALGLYPRNTDALRALVDLLVRSRPAGELLALVAEHPDTASARDVSNALVSLLARPGEPLPAREATEATVQLARAWPRMRMGTPYFDVALREPLTIAAELQPAVRPGLRSMIEAYSLRPQNAPYRESENARWWHSDDGDPNGKRAAWSTLLRSIGDWHYEQGSLNVARSYYEAAIGLRERALNSPSIDRSALLPLALIYAQVSDTTSSSRLHAEMRQFTETMFSAKGAAYRAGDLEQIRDFHMTLGALYAARGQWTGPGAQNAEFQLEHMRQATRALNRVSRTPVVDPPDLLEKLAIHYKVAGRANAAASVKRDVIQQYERLGRPDEAAAAGRRIDTAQAVPR